METVSKSITETTEELVARQRKADNQCYLHRYYGQHYEPLRFQVIETIDQDELNAWHNAEIKMWGRLLAPLQIEMLINKLRESNNKDTFHYFGWNEGKQRYDPVGQELLNNLKTKIQSYIEKINFDINADDVHNTHLVDQVLFDNANYIQWRTMRESIKSTKQELE